MKDKVAVKVEKCKAEEVRRRLKALGVLDDGFKPMKCEGYVFFPVKYAEGLNDILGNYSFEVVTICLEEREKKPRSLREILEKILPRDLHQYIPSSIDLVGSIALIDIPEELEDYKEDVGRAVMTIYPHVEAVFSKEGETIGDYRIRSLKLVVGKPKTETIYREHGCIYKLDLSKVFFNPRMSGERLRIALKIKENECILDMFAGVGPFSILIAKKNPSVKVVAVEINPEAYNFLLDNIKLNGVSDRVEAVKGDVRDVLRECGEVFDRVIMDLPFKALEFLDLALKIVKRDGIIHLYHVEEGVNVVDKASGRILMEAEKMNHEVEVIYSHEVLEVAPRKFIVVLDLVKRK
ncbi:MAG: class I SAM-dependent methyltransferase family protein [Aigarchaeota archaeon]|nr:class I SAM-dependent methyltransferase family protein [Aigarchaeota archaeon]MCX8192651.1 class I SAM-dependent methyltransferase family protein [Nitrososphaeria archaeon]MDW7985611.1 class I SAM-dependent methyltransferase family protein [Nitrososphaerota archaeon]